MDIAVSDFLIVVKFESNLRIKINDIDTFNKSDLMLYIYRSFFVFLLGHHHKKNISDKPSKFRQLTQKIENY